MIAILPPPVIVEPSLYTLRELCTRVSISGLAVSVSGPEADAVYAVALRNARPENVLAALGATGRVTVVRSASGATLRRNPDAERNAARCAQALREGIRDRISAFRFEETQRIKTLSKLGDADRDSEIERLKSERGDRLQAQMGEDLYLYFGGELPYTALAAQVPSLTMYSQFPSPMFVMSADTMPQAFCPGGDVASDPYFRTAFPPDATPERRRAALRTMQMGARWAYDPATHGVSFRLVWCNPDGGPVPFGRVYGPASLSHLALPRPPDPAPVVPIAPSPGADDEVPVPEGPRRLTERLLDCAAATGTPLVAYVGGFSDRWLPSAKRSSLAATVLAANVGAFDPALERERSARRGVEPGAVPVRGCRLRLASAGGIAVVADDREYLDEFQAPGWEPPTALLNQTYRDRRLTLALLDAALARLPVAEGRGLPYPERWLPWCDPAAQHPFARLLARRPEEARRIDALPVGSSYRIPLRSLDARSKAEFQEALGRCQQIVDDLRDVTIDPAVASQALRRYSNGTEAVVAKRTPKGYEFRLEVPQGTLWASNIWLGVVPSGR